MCLIKKKYYFLSHHHNQIFNCDLVSHNFEVLCHDYDLTKPFVLFFCGRNGLPYFTRKI